MKRFVIGLAVLAFAAGAYSQGAGKVSTREFSFQPGSNVFLQIQRPGTTVQDGASLQLQGFVTPEDLKKAGFTKTGKGTLDYAGASSPSAGKTSEATINVKKIYEGARSQSQNNLKQLGIGVHSAQAVMLLCRKAAGKMEAYSKITFGDIVIKDSKPSRDGHKGEIEILSFSFGWARVESIRQVDGKLGSG